MRTSLRKVIARVVARAGRLIARVPPGEWVALVIAVLAIAVGPAAVLGSGRWASHDVITIKAVQWAYELKTIYLTQGVPAHVRLISEDVVHGFAIEGLGVEVDDLLPGHAVDITVTPTQAGTYDVLCTRYCGVHHGLMFRQVIVRPARSAHP